ncbi:proton channel OTOP2-like [Petromyzon marinus]|uniref:Proton channel OTOP2-like n=1 Tax=Petromyzon marinus TaxID=7757 RepID=A0AAJ7WQN1_PETMA|nr:proton channel OTOP2-like [Petromyzon marinus]XP_032806556.1 proton channel OTOP2-like [Petromyzon marinus]
MTEPSRSTADTESQGDDVGVHVGAVEEGRVPSPPATSSSLGSSGTSSSIVQPLVQSKAGVVFSSLYAINLIIFGATFKFAEILNPNHLVTHAEMYIFLSVIVTISILYMVGFVLHMRRVDTSSIPMDHHAGAKWLKGGLALFALATIILDAFRIGYYTGMTHCESVALAIFPVLQAIFSIILVLLLWVYGKYCVREWQTLHRLGMMHTLATSILIWFNTVIEESIKVIKEIDHSTEVLPSNVTYNETECTCQMNFCQMFYDSVLFLDPFNIEFSLFSSAMLYVMWKNMGRIDAHSVCEPHVKPKMRMDNVLLGPIFGIVVLASTLVVLVTVEVQVRTPATKGQALSMYYLYGIVIYSSMAICGVAGLVIYKLGNSGLRNDKNVVRNLDVLLLIGSSIGLFTSAYFSVIAAGFSLSPETNFSTLVMAAAFCKIVELISQNLFIIEGLHRSPRTVLVHDQGSSPTQRITIEAINGAFESDSPSVFTPVSQRKLHLNAPNFRAAQDAGIFSNALPSTPKCLNNFDGIGDAFEVRNPSREATEMAISPMSQHSLQFQISEDLNDVVSNSLKESSECVTQAESIGSLTTDSSNRSSRTARPPLDAKTYIIKNFTIYLLLCNMSLWIITAFGERLHLINSIGDQFYGFSAWVVAINFSIPLGVFYRMHSVASLFEVFCTT